MSTSQTRCSARIRRATGAALLLSLQFGLAHAGEVLVTGVKGRVSWTRGQLLAEGTPIDLPEGAELKVVTEQQTILRLRGPFHGRIPTTGPNRPASRAVDGGEGGSLLRGLGALLAPLEALGSVLTRGEGTALAKDPWLIDLTTGGDKCVAKEGTATFWHSAPTTATSMRVKAWSHSFNALSDWPAGIETLPWPARVPIIDGMRYLVASPVMPQERSVTLHVAPASFKSAVETATWMLSQHCNDQALRLLDGLPDAQETHVTPQREPGP